ncbi:MAG: hypothetical protein JXR27_09465 [Paludibacteraceae bacterium]|nr:hypothetical protein [Paludibacteraceae bacterium]
MKQQQNPRFWYLFTAFALLFLVSCDTYDYTDTNDYEYTTPDTVMQSQLVTVTFDGAISVSKPVAKIDTFNIDLVVSDSAFSFIVPSTLPAGKMKLRVNSLGYLTIDYHVKELVLPKPATEVMSDFSETLDDIDAQFGKESAKNNEQISNIVTQFKTYYNSLGAKEKNELTKVYWANKETYDALLKFSSQQDSVPQKISNKMRLNLAGFIASVGFIGIGSEAISIKNPYVAILGVATAGIATAAAITTLQNMYDEVYVDNKSIFERITDGLFDANAAMFTKTAANNNYIELISGRTKSVNVTNEATNVHSGLSSSSNLQMKSFFWAYNTLDDFVNDLNKLIEWGNENVPFFNFDLISFDKIATSAQEKNYLMETDDFENYSFTVSDNRISIEKANFGGSGKINFQLKILDDVKVDTIVAKLNYEYDGFFNSHSGSVDIRIIRRTVMSTLEKLAAWGPWKSQEFEGEVYVNEQSVKQQQYFVMTFNAQNEKYFTVRYYNANTNTLSETENMCLYIRDNRMYIEDGCGSGDVINETNYFEFDYLTITKLEEDELILNDDGFSWVCSPLK